MNDENQQNMSLPSVDQPLAGPAHAGNAPQMQMPPATSQAGSPPMHQAQGQSMQSVIAASLPMSAQDVDLIEKAWVEKAKQIVARTHGDPYLQSKAMSQVKSDYIRKRYGKDIKVSE